MNTPTHHHHHYGAQGMSMAPATPYQHMMQNNGGMGFTPTVCPIMDLPVCGSNGQTYQNECFMRQAGCGKAYDGWCIHGAGKSAELAETEEEKDTLDSKTPGNGFDPDSNDDCPCDATFNPVCAANGITFANACRAHCRGMRSVHYGPCGYFNWKNKTGEDECSCDLNFNPVCAINKVTFENACVLNCHKFKSMYTGICPKPCGCRFQYKPVCGSTGRSYINQCYLACNKSVTKIADGECSADSMGACQHCAGYVKPVCSTDQESYDNECYLKCEKKTALHDGKCIPRDENGKCICKEIDLPVCGENNETYQNECEMRCAGKKLIHTGKCGSLAQAAKPQSCPCPGMQPVCGSDGVSYKNPCALRCKSVLKPIVVVQNGECQPLAPPQCPCGTDYHPVCGVDGKTYLNICVLRCLRVNKAFDGKCTLGGGVGPDYIMNNIARKPAAQATAPSGGGISGGNITNNFWAQTFNQNKWRGAQPQSPGNGSNMSTMGTSQPAPQHWSVNVGGQGKRGYNINVKQNINNSVTSRMGMMNTGASAHTPRW